MIHYFIYHSHFRSIHTMSQGYMTNNTSIIIGSVASVLSAGTGFAFAYYWKTKNGECQKQKQVLTQDKQKPHVKPIFLTNNAKKAKEISLLFGFPFDTMPFNETMNPLDQVTELSTETFRPVIREEIEVIVGNKKFDNGYQITEEDLNSLVGQTMNITLKVYVAEPGSVIKVFYNRTNGKVVPKVNTLNSLCFGWDHMFVPNGYQCTIAEMGQHRNMFNFRSQVYEQISDYLSGRPSTSIYEGHITLSHSDKTLSFEEQKKQFTDLCSKLGVKAILIELQSGKPVNGNFQFQTSQWFNRPFNEVRKSMKDMSKEFMDNQWIVERQKIEATPSLRIGSENCPIEDDEIKDFPSTNYFEFHAKVSMTDNNKQIIEQLSKDHQAHLSRNAFKKFDQYDHRFLTLRLRGIGQKTAFAKFDALLDSLKDANIEIAGTQREYAVWDTNHQLDAGWIN